MISYDVTTFGAPLERIERPAPEPHGREALLRVLATGVCHTDIHTWHGYYDLGGGRRLTMGDRGVSLPLTLGHEIVGEVVRTGPDADAALVGRRCLVHPWIGCGACKVCRRGDEPFCMAPRFLGIFRPGGYSDHVLVPDARYLVDIGDMRPEHAAPYACSGLSTYSAIKKIRPQVLRDEPVVVIGAGGLGLMCVSLLRALGGAGTVVVETDAGRREAALRAGACAAVDGSDAQARRLVRQAVGDAAWAVIDCVGSGQTVQLGLDVLAKGGQLIVVGLFGGQLSLPTAMIPMRAMSVEGSYVGRLDDLRALIELVRTQRIEPIPTSCRHLHEAGKALEDLEQGRVVGRVVLQPDPDHAA